LKSFSPIMSKNNCAVVLIDDSEVDIFLHEQLIMHAGGFAPVWSFSTPEAALDHLASLAFSEPKSSLPIIILLDIKMPNMDGFSFVSRFESLPAAVKDRCSIVMLSATLRASDTLRAEAIPAIAAFVNKPLTVNLLRGLAATIISAR